MHKWYLLLSKNLKIIFLSKIKIINKKKVSNWISKNKLNIWQEHVELA